MLVYIATVFNVKPHSARTGTVLYTTFGCSRVSKANDSVVYAI